MIKKMKSVEFAELEKWLSLSSPSTVNVRKEFVSELVDKHYEWVVLAMLQYFWNDIVSEAGRSNYISSIYHVDT
eukprot:SAG11_NODE_2390_length_3412_cov_7.894959_4_plen_74_part_00